MLPRLVGSGLSGEGALWDEWRVSPMKPVVPATPAQAWLEPLSALADTGPGPMVQPWKSMFGSNPETWFSWSQTLLSPHLLPGPICGSASQVLCTPEGPRVIQNVSVQSSQWSGRAHLSVY